jgi:hypothetical protein
MRNRMVAQAIKMQTLCADRLANMTEEEVRALTPGQVVALFRAGTDAERKAREIDPDELEGDRTGDVPSRASCS